MPIKFEDEPKKSTIKFDAEVAPSATDFSVPTKENLAESERQAKARGAAYARQEPGVVEKVLASPEVPISLVQNIPVSLAGAIATGGKAEPMADFMQKYGYKFKTRGGQAVAEQLGKVAESLPPVLGMGGAGEVGCNLIRLDNYEIQNVDAVYGSANTAVYRQAAGQQVVRFADQFDFTDAAMTAGGQTLLPVGVPLAVVLNNALGLKPAIANEPQGIYGNLTSRS